MTHPNHERGGVLLYAVIAVAFLSGLSLYLQKMSDPKIFQTNDTQKILNTEYLSDSMETLLSITASNNSLLLKNENNVIDPSTNNVTANFIANSKKILTDQKELFLFSNNNLLIGSAKKTSLGLNDRDIESTIIRYQPLSIHTSGQLDYDLKSITIRTNKKLKVTIKF